MISPTPKQYMAGSVPRSLRQTKLGYLPVNCLIGSRAMTGDNGANLVFDIIMLPVPEFQRMKSNMGLQHVMAPALKADASFNPVFLIPDVKHVIVPIEEPDPETFARNYFMMEFGLIKPEQPQAPKPEAAKPEEPPPPPPPQNPPPKPPEIKGSPFSRSARDYTRLKE